MSAPASTVQRPAEATKSWMAGLGEVGLPPAEGAPRAEEQETEDQPPASPPAAPKAPPAAEPPPAKPASKPDAQPSATKPEDKSDEEKWPRSAQEWKKFREKHAGQLVERDAKISTLEKELSEVRGKASSTIDPTEFESIKKERDQYSERLSIVGVERHPKFENYFKQKTDAQMDMAKRIVGEENFGIVSQLLQMEDSEYRTIRLEEVVESLPALKKIQFGGVLNNLDGIRAERASEIAKAGETYKTLRASEVKAFEERKGKLDQSFQEGIAKAAGKDGTPMYQLRDGDAAWNADVQRRIDGAKALLFSEQNPQLLVDAALNAMAYQPLIKALQAQLAEMDKMKAQIEELTKASPRLESGAESGSAEVSEQRPEPKIGMRPMDVTGGWMKALPKLGQ